MRKSFLPHFIQSRKEKLDILSIFDPLIKEEARWIFRFEVRRQLFHFSYGVGICLLIFFLGYESLLIFIPVLLFGLTCSLLVRKGIRIPFITRMLDIFDRQEDVDVLPGKGAIFFLVGTIIAQIFFPKFAIIGVLVLAASDSFSTLVGKVWGKRRWRKEETKGKTLEGSIGFFLLTSLIIFIGVWLILPLFTPYLLLLTFFTSILATIGELQPYIDDNIVIPFLVAGLLFLFNQLVIYANVTS